MKSKVIVFLFIIVLIFIIIFLFQFQTKAAGVYHGSLDPHNNDSLTFSVSLPDLEGNIISIYTVDDYFRSEKVIVKK